MNNDIRWKQRFQNFSRAFVLLRSAFDECSFDELNQLEQEGAIQRFEYTWELTWKTIKDFLEYHGVLIPPPAGSRNVIKQAAALFFDDAGIDGETFIDMLVTRNELSHTYDFEKFKDALKDIQNRYVPQLEELYTFLLEKSINE
ncbi:MAG: nucleotidyltransferase substrate binding protein [Spirochaetaceae bacterium]|jgi:nucleotidyltransferase substrate binding protein (TIGR01987 family)|nr:nucleotidyltransferase substrate binding protein [Spirochaetaceae bacterium]